MSLNMLEITIKTNTKDHKPSIVNKNYKEKQAPVHTKQLRKNRSHCAI